MKKKILFSIAIIVLFLLNGLAQAGIQNVENNKTILRGINGSINLFEKKSEILSSTVFIMALIGGSIWGEMNGSFKRLFPIKPVGEQQFVYFTHLCSIVCYGPYDFDIQISFPKKTIHLESSNNSDYVIFSTRIGLFYSDAYPFARYGEIGKEKYLELTGMECYYQEYKL